MNFFKTFLTIFVLLFVLVFSINIAHAKPNACGDENGWALTITIKGTITDADLGSNIQGANVSIDSPGDNISLRNGFCDINKTGQTTTVLTGDNGTYEINVQVIATDGLNDDTDTPGCKLFLNVSKSGYVSNNAIITKADIHDNKGSDGNWTCKDATVQDRTLKNAVQITSPTANSDYDRGKTVTITATVKDADGNAVTDAFVAATLPTSIPGGTIDLTHQGSGTYSTDYTIGWHDSSGQWNITVNASGYGSNKVESSVNWIYLTNMNITSPTNGAKFSAGQNVTINATILYPNDTPVTAGNVNATAPNGGYFALTHKSNGIWSGLYSITQTDVDNYDTWDIDVYVEDDAIEPNIGNTTTNAEQIDVTIQKPANLTISLVTDLITDGHTNVNQTYHVDLTVSNIGEATAENVVVNLTAANSTIAVGSFVIGDINGGDSVTKTFTVTSPAYETTDVLLGETTGDDANSKNSLYANVTYDVITEAGAGGDDKELNVTTVIANPILIDGAGRTITVITATVLNDGDATALSTTPAYVIHSGNDCSGAVSNAFTVSGPEPADANIAGSNTADFAYNVSTTTAASGNYTICITASAIDGNDGSMVGSNENYATFTVDADIPIIILDSPADNSYFADNSTAFEFKFTVTDNLDAVLDVVLNITGIGTNVSTADNATQKTLTFELPEGTHTWSVTATDDAGNTATSAIYTLTIDLTPPTITITSPAEGSIMGPSALLSANTSEAATCRYGTTSAPTALMTTTGNLVHSEQIVALTNGTQNYYVNCSDRVNLTAEANVTWYVDAEGPQIILDSPANGSGIKAGEYINFTITDLSNVSTAWYSTNGGLTNTTFTDPYDLDTTGWSGSISLIVWANDTWGNMNDSLSQIGILTFYVDNTPPVITLVSPTNNSQIQAGTTLVFSITDNVAVSDAWYSIDGGANTSFATQYNLSTSGWSDGNHNVKVYANDTVGNLADTISGFGIDGINFTVDSTPPSVIINKPTAGWNPRLIPVNATVTDANTVAKVYYRWENTTTNGNWTLMVYRGNDTWTATFDSVKLAAGNYTVRINATDKAGNINDTEKVDNVAIDSSPPKVEITSPLDSQLVTKGSALQVTANITEIGSGIDPNAICNVTIENENIANITYNATTGLCDGTVLLPTTGMVAEKYLGVSIVDIAGNLGTDNVVIIFPIPSGGGGGGGGGGAPALNETPKKLNIEVNVTPESYSMLSDETAEFTFEIKNVGEAPIYNIRLTTYDLNEGEYIVVPEKTDLFPGETTTVIFFVTPVSLDTGIYKISVSVGTSTYNKGVELTLAITNATEARARDNVLKKCDAASAYLSDLSGQGINTTTLSTNLSKARTYIAEGNFADALPICEAILAVKPEQLTTGGITGLFISIGSFAATNLVWLLVASGIVLGTFIGRRQLAEGLVGIKKGFKKGGAGGTATKPKVAKPEAPKATNVKTNGKTNGTKTEAPKSGPSWEISWKK